MIRNHVQAKATTEPGIHPAGPNLILQVNPPGKKDSAAGKPHGSRAWMVRWKAEGKVRKAKLADLDAMPHSEAVRRAARHMDAIRSAPAPSAAPAPSSASMTFREAADAYLAARDWTGAHAAFVRQWHYTLQDLCAGFGAKAVREVTPQDIGDVVAFVAQDRAATARTMPHRLATVFDFAGVDPSPMDDGGLRRRLRVIGEARGTQGHHKAMPYDEVPALAAKAWAARSNVSARLVLFAILTAARRAEAGEATWDEVDLDAAVWSIPGERMKAGKPHTVPLSRQAVALLRECHPATGYVFRAPAAAINSTDEHVNLESARAWLQRNAPDKPTLHGFRSSFRDWVLEQTNHGRELAEIALAHSPGKVEGAYRRGEAVERRRAMMQDWADHLLPNT